MNRTTAFYRDARRKTINRKKEIIKKQNYYWFYSHEGMLSKGKIHCSCPMCRCKSYDEAQMTDKRKSLNQISELIDLSESFYTKPYIHKIISRTKHVNDSYR